MTEKEIKAVLREVMPTRRLITQHMEEVERLRSMARNISSAPISGMPHGGGEPDKLGAAVAKLCDMADETEQYVEFYHKKLRQAYCLIELADDIDGKAIITARYLNGRQWDFIPGLLNMSRSNMFAHYNKAIKEISEKS